MVFVTPFILRAEGCTAESSYVCTVVLSKLAMVFMYARHLKCLDNELCSKWLVISGTAGEHSIHNTRALKPKQLNGFTYLHTSCSSL